MTTTIKAEPTILGGGPLTLRERVLRRFCLAPDQVTMIASHDEVGPQWNLDNALSELLVAFPDLLPLTRGKRVLDYGCGDGFQAVALAKSGAAHVHGVEIREKRIRHGQELARREHAVNATFGLSIDGEFDVVISLNSLEHFPEPAQNLAEMIDALRPDGRILVSFGPPWFAPYGAHMHFFCPVPWVHLLFSERTVLRVRNLYRTDTMDAYYPQLNRMSVAWFEKLVRDAGLTIERKRYRCVKNVEVIGRIPVLRELFVNQIDAVLRK